MWKDFILNLNSIITIEFNTPASENELLKAEESLDIKLPKSLKNLLLETNGFKNDTTIWSSSKIIDHNISMRNTPAITENFMPLDSLLFFGDAGNGDYFGFPIINGEIWKGDVYAWNHEDDSRIWVASSLKNFLKVWLSGELSI